jgi:2-hydroxychromene-2-carboxylate isomerase
MTKKKIDFYFDFLSPYSYVAWTWVRTQSEFFDFNFIPVSIPKIISTYGTLGPAQIKPKRNYLFKDLIRYTTLHNIPFTTPLNLPFNSLYALRLSLLSVAEKSQRSIIDAIFRAGWEEGQDIGNDDILKNILKNKNIEVESLFKRMEDPTSRIELKKNIDLALTREVFGVPTFFVDDEMFWGNDSIKYLEMYLANKDPLNLEKYTNFLNKHQF